MKQTYSSRLPRWAARPLAALGLLLATAGAAQAQTFAKAVTYTAGGGAVAGLTVVDVNRDGKPDMLASNFDSNGTVAVLLGTGTGTFGTATTFGSGGAYPVGIVSADVNGDGKLDIVVANQQSNTVAVLLGTGTGTFGTAVTFSSGGTSPTDLAVADVNGDSKPDIVVTNQQSGTAAVLLGTGTGSFGAAVGYSTTTSGVLGVVIADVNNDSKLDLIVGTYTGSAVAVLLGTGTGTFGAATTFTVGANLGPGRLALADVNADSRLDIVTANYGSNTAAVLLGTGTGSFGSAALYNCGGGSPQDIAVADVNSDGRLDLLTANATNNTAGVLPGAGAGTFGTAATFSTGAGNTYPYAIRATDVNGDGQPDLLIANYYGNTLGVLLNTTVNVAPTLATISPNPAAAGTSVTLTGTNLTGATAVSFNGTAATTFAVVNSTTVTATVPTGATSGNVTVTTPGGTSNGVAFTVVTNAPVVTAPANNSLLTTRSPNIMGTAPAGSTVTLYLASGSGAAQVIGTTTAPGGSFSFTPATALADGRYSVYATAQSSGSSVSANSNTNAFTVDATPPTATVSTTASSPTSTTPIPFTVTFSEAITGFSASSVTVSNGTITSAITNVGNAYSFSVTPAANGVVSVSLAANVVQDAAGNGNTAAGPLSVTYAAPVTATTWTGTISTDWYTAGNWTAGVPTVTVNATISASAPFQPAIGSGTASTRSLSLSSGTTLSMSGGTLDVRGTFANNGALAATGGTVVLGTSAQAPIVGSSTTRFWNLSADASGVLLATSAGAAVQQVLTLNGDFATNGNAFTLLSTAASTALVVNNGGVVNGTTTVQRAISPSLNPGSGYRHYAAPVSNSTVADLATSSFAPVLNPLYNTSATPNAVTPFPTVFGYDDSRLSLPNNLTPFDKGYFSPSTLSDPLVVGRGYTVNIAASELVDFQGTLNNGTIQLPLTSTRSTYPDGGWQLLGNPYPAPLNYALVAAADRVGLDAAIYVYSSTSQYAGQYRIYINGIGNPVLPVGQGFFARVAAGQPSATITFRNSQRLTAPNGTTLQRPAADLRPQVQLELRASTGLADTFYAYAESGATAPFDSQYDAVKVPNTNGLNLAGTAASGEPLAIDGRPAFLATTVLPLTVGVPAAGTYTLAAADLANLPAGLAAYLADAATGQTLLLAPGTSYSFSVSAAQATALLSGRFSLLFRLATPLATTAALTADVVSVYPNPAHERFTVVLPGLAQAATVQADLLNALGQVVRRQSAALPTAGTRLTLETANLATGIYTLRLQAGSSTLAKRVVLE